MSDETPEEAEEDEPTRCRKCGSHYNLRDGEDPTPYCDWCAHKVVDELTAKLADAERDVALGVIERKLHNVHQQKWLKEKIEAEDERAAAIARAEAEKSRRVAYQTIVYSVCNLLDTATGSKIVCGDGDNPTREVQDTVTVLIKSRDELRREVEALKANNNPPQ